MGLRGERGNRDTEKAKKTPKKQNLKETKTYLPWLLICVNALNRFYHVKMSPFFISASDTPASFFKRPLNYMDAQLNSSVHEDKCIYSDSTYAEVAALGH